MTERITTKRVLAAAIAASGFSEAALTGDRRGHATLARWRQAAMALCREIATEPTGRQVTFERVGDTFKRHHSTVKHAEALDAGFTADPEAPGAWDWRIKKACIRAALRTTDA